MRWVTANDLENWARSLSSRDELPKVVSDLIRASAQDIATMRFPSGNKGQVRGFDGHLVCDTAGFNVPRDRSYWEFGTNRDYKVKSASDFNKRTMQVSPAERADITFVFVSPWTWDSSDPANKLEDWVTARQKSSSWKDVRYIDGSALEIWLEHCPAVAAWHARNTFGLRPQEGVRSTDEFWSDFAGQFGPSLTEDVVLCGRETAAQQLLTDLMQPSNTVQLVADSPDEVVAFAVAAMRKADPNVRLYLEARTLVVDSAAAGRQLLATNNLVLLLRNDAARSPGQFSTIGPVLVPLGRKQSGGAAPTLDRPSGQAMGAAMKSMGLEENRALTYARGCGRSLTALARLIPGGTYEDPPWLKSGPELLPAILAGAWNTTNDMDRAIIERIADGATCGQVEGRVRALLRDMDPPFDLEGSVWKVCAPMDAFVRVGPLIDAGQAARLREAMIKVFSAIEPDTDPDDVVSFTRPNPTGYSEWLRDGLATTFLLFAVWSRTAGVNLGAQTGQKFADGLLRDLPGLNSDPRVLTSLRNELPLLAEAAPDPLLEALEHMLQGNGDLIRPIFEEHKGLLFPTYKHTGILWALETIAWDPAYFRRAVLVLAGLAAIAPGIRRGNTPANTLSEIFVLWNPNTNASAAARLSALKEISSLHPAVGWALVKTLLPTMHGMSAPTAKPKLREAGASDRPAVTYREFWENQAAVARLAIELAGDDEPRWLELIPGLSQFGSPERELAVRALDRTMARATAASLKRIWTKLRDEVARHERFQSAKWALQSDDLAAFQALATKYAPDDPFAAVAGLFDTWALDETGDVGRDNQRRAEALRQLYDERGPYAVLRLAAEARVPYLVIEAAEMAGFTESQVEELLRMSFGQDTGGTLTLGLSGLYRRIAGEVRAEAWLRRNASNVSADALSDLLQTWPDGLSTWGVVRRFGATVVSSYWQRRSPRYVNDSRRTLLQAALMYLRFGRAIEAIQSSLDRLAEVPTRLIFRMLDGVIPEINSRAAPADTMTSFYVERAFEALDHRPDAPNEQIAAREYGFLPLLEYSNRSLRIHKLMASDPALYHQVLRDVFEGENEELGDLDDKAKARARISYSLLTHFSQLPGLSAAGLDEHALGSWIAGVRQLGVDTDRAAVTDNFVGRLLAHAPPDADGGWPHRSVRDEIERAQSMELERGIQLERYNMRGVHGKQVFEGGDQERALAEESARNARLAAAWPRTSALLSAIARGWERDAEREDMEAAQRKLRS